MNIKTCSLLAALAWAELADPAHADCAASARIADTQHAFEDAQALERAGDEAAAFRAYIAAQAPTCEPNPVEVTSAKQAAKLALSLGAAAEKRGELEKAFDIYDSGGQYAAADRALMALVRSQPDNRAVFDKAKQALAYRALPAFQSNNKIRLDVTAAYHPEPLHLAEVMAMPVVAAERALQREATAFDEQYLREFQKIMESRPDDPTDVRAIQRFVNARKSFINEHSGVDPIKASQDALAQVSDWQRGMIDRNAAAHIEILRQQRIELRIAQLTQSFAGVPQYLETAKAYYYLLGLGETATKARLASLKTQAKKLGDTAVARHRYLLAAEYYDVAENGKWAEAARNAQQKVTMSKLQPSLDEGQKQAARLQQEFSDPAKVQATREQALAMQQRLREQQAQGGKSKRADDLEKELGI